MEKKHFLAEIERQTGKIFPFCFENSLYIFVVVDDGGSLKEIRQNVVDKWVVVWKNGDISSSENSLFCALSNGFSMLRQGALDSIKESQRILKECKKFDDHQRARQ